MTGPAPEADTPTRPADGPEDHDGPTRTEGWGLALVAIAVSLFSIGVIVAVVVTLASAPDVETRTFTVPSGTAVALSEGKSVTIMPPEVNLRVGDTLVVRNEDNQTITVGPYTVRAGETLKQTFTRPQTLVGECSVSGSGEIKIIVT